MTYQRDPETGRRNPLRYGRTDGSTSWLSGLIVFVVVLGVLFLGYSMLRSTPDTARRTSAEAPQSTAPAPRAPSAPAPTPAPAPQTK